MVASPVRIRPKEPAAAGVPTILGAVREKEFSKLLRFFLVTGLFFMLVPGTFLGVWNLISISSQRGLAKLSPDWVQAHGHAQVFGWIGSFILGIGFYSLPNIKLAVQGKHFSPGWTCWGLWTVGVFTRWFANIYHWQWRILVPASAALELAAFLIFLRAVSRHKSEPGKKMQAWTGVVVAATAAFLAALLVNLGGCIYVAGTADTPAFPRAFDQPFLFLLGWGVLVPMVLGFSARWLPVFLGLRETDKAELITSVVLIYAAVIAAGLGSPLFAAMILPGAVLMAIFSLSLFRPPVNAPKLIGVDARFPYFVRLAYQWLMMASVISLWAANSDRFGGIWGASRHALTVGFISTMVFAIGSRVLPHFSGSAKLFSTRLMLAALVLLNIGCFLRVSSEILAYENYAGFAWRVLPVSAIIELTAVTIFALNLALTFLRPMARPYVAPTAAGTGS